MGVICSPSPCGDDDAAKGGALSAAPFREIWFVDFEFRQDLNGLPDPVCLVAHELRSGRCIRQWRDDMGERPPYDIGDDALFVAYYASAELGCHLSLGWSLPTRIIDLYAEFRNLTNGSDLPAGRGLLGALAQFGLPTMDTGRKELMRELVLRGGPWSSDDRAAIIDYCAEDVHALRNLWDRMGRMIDLPRALLRGRYWSAVALMERTGVPVDTATLDDLRERWDELKGGLIDQIDAGFGVYVGRSFNAQRFGAYLNGNGIPWPQTAEGRLQLSDEVFSDMSKAYPALAPLHELRKTLSGLKLERLAVWADGRNRQMLSPFGSKTGRNQPSSNKFIFGPSVWLRGLITPRPGTVLIYIDWKQQEFGVAAALSGDERMQDAYRSGDPYLEFAKQTGAAPPDATRETHKGVREQFKACVLAVQYGMEADSLACRIGQPPIVARQLLRKHKETYRDFWKWSDAVVDFAMTRGYLQTVFGWRVAVTQETNARSLRNFPMQANGAEMLRLACCLGTEAGVRICAPVHDAVLIEADEATWERDVEQMQEAMREASRIVLDGFELGTDIKVIRDHERYTDPRGDVMWRTTAEILRDLKRG